MFLTSVLQDPQLSVRNEGTSFYALHARRTHVVQDSPARHYSDGGGVPDRHAPGLLRGRLIVGHRRIFVVHPGRPLDRHAGQVEGQGAVVTRHLGLAVRPVGSVAFQRFSRVGRLGRPQAHVDFMVVFRRSFSSQRAKYQSHFGRGVSTIFELSVLHGSSQLCHQPSEIIMHSCQTVAIFSGCPGDGYP